MMGLSQEMRKDISPFCCLFERQEKCHKTSAATEIKIAKMGILTPEIQAARSFELSFLASASLPSPYMTGWAEIIPFLHLIFTRQILSEELFFRTREQKCGNCGAKKFWKMTETFLVARNQGEVFLELIFRLWTLHRIPISSVKLVCIPAIYPKNANSEW